MEPRVPDNPKPRNMLVSKIRERCDPFRSTCWADLDTPITLAEVTAATLCRMVGPRSPRQAHIDIIAEFVIQGWDDPIGVDVGVPSMGCNPAWIIDDGNHRFAAAIVRGDRTIAVNASGAMDEIDALCS